MIMSNYSKHKHEFIMDIFDERRYASLNKFGNQKPKYVKHNTSISQKRLTQHPRARNSIHLPTSLLTRSCQFVQRIACNRQATLPMQWSTTAAFKLFKSLPDYDGWRSKFGTRTSRSKGALMPRNRRLQKVMRTVCTSPRREGRLKNMLINVEESIRIMLRNLNQFEQPVTRRLNLTRRATQDSVSLVNQNCGQLLVVNHKEKLF